MTDKTRTIKIRSSTYRRLKIAAAERGMTMLDLLDQLVKTTTAQHTASDAPQHDTSAKCHQTK